MSSDDNIFYLTQKKIFFEKTILLQVWGTWKRMHDIHVTFNRRWICHLSIEKHNTAN